MTYPDIEQRTQVLYQSPEFSLILHDNWRTGGGTRGYTEELAESGWSDSKLAQDAVPEFLTWHAMQITTLMSTPNYIITVYGDAAAGDPEPWGGCVLVQGEDAQVGTAAYAWHVYMATRGLQRAMIKLRNAMQGVARYEMGCDWLVLPHRFKDQVSYKVMNRYIDLRDKE